MFPTGTLSFQASQQIRPGDGISFNINMIKCFLGINRQKIKFKKKKQDIPSKDLKSPEAAINEIIETIIMKIILIVMNQNITQQ